MKTKFKYKKKKSRITGIRKGSLFVVGQFNTAQQGYKRDLSKITVETGKTRHRQSSTGPKIYPRKLICLRSFNSNEQFILNKNVWFFYVIPRKIRCHESNKTRSLQKNFVEFFRFLLYNNLILNRYAHDMKRSYHELQQSLDELLEREAKRVQRSEVGQTSITQFFPIIRPGQEPPTTALHAERLEEEPSSSHNKSEGNSIEEERSSSSSGDMSDLESAPEEMKEIEEIKSEDKEEHDIEEDKADSELAIRVSYTSDQKEKIYRLLAVRTVEEVYQMLNRRVPKINLYKWKENLLKGQSPSNKKRGGRKAQHPDLENALYEWFVFQRSRKIPVNDKQLQAAAMQIAEELGLEDCKCSLGYIARFKKRNGLVQRSATRFATKRAGEMKQLIAEFFNKVNKLVPKYSKDDIWNYDEIPVYFEPVINRTLAPKGEEVVPIISVQAQRSRMTLVTVISGSGKVLPPILLYLAKGFTPFEEGNALITHNGTGYVNKDILHHVIMPFILSHIDPGALMLFDDHKAHSSDEVKKLLDEHCVQYVIIPGGATCLLQPVDCGVGKSIKMKVKSCFQKWVMSEYEKIILPGGRRIKTFKKPTNQMIAQWILKGYKKLRAEAIVGAFEKTGIISKEGQVEIINSKISKYFVAEKDDDNLHREEDSESDEVEQEQLSSNKASVLLFLFLVHGLLIQEYFACLTFRKKTQILR
eukprot:TRINITY_DN2184_c0_g1_i1.p1 TRINITY_DN2184_c0_g1~~TRINITY_DN2184_c0_g1_i1.p1  ORF type:complete len:724 (+),score=45.23 TRINITY_DN2184_c0_g1_i1:74-2173(+)